ncbi:hypothetical protein WN944_028154 [Citrus x changshan-huyou]|uniref:Uncharacterized protein n=1 Tax=Citrus x changshan-huyou TaxID=2935761 RepID=A0AAP0LJA4_9ROSI
MNLNPQAEILKTSVIKDSDAPIVASFSSRGPNKYVPDILKPDISAPGVNILAAYSPLAPVSRDIEDERHVKYNIISGTSMACPHAAGVAAYVKSFHPDWSPSAIKSAIMTTAWPMNSSKNTQAEFAYGSGHINPVKAINPGLVYGAFKQDYINMLCSMGYDVDKLRTISGDNSTCSKGSEKTSPKDLNYPSMAAQVSSGESFTIKFPRTVTNIGLPNSTYKAGILQNSKISVNVVPEVLSFRSLNEKKSFIVTVTGKGLASGSIVSAALVWFDGSRIVCIVYMGSLPDGDYLPSSHHESIMQNIVEGRSVKNILVRSYTRSFNGFVAMLTDQEREKLAKMEEVVSVFPSRTLQLHTTRSWDFMGFNVSVTRNRSVESDLIVGVIDTGIWPESESFSDEGFGPAPKRWKARDEEGHGSHTASTAAGNKVEGVSFFGLGQGTARGGVPSARISAYKVCSEFGCSDANILAAFDDAIADGVDIITISMGTRHAREFSQDSIAIGAFHAMAKGILVVNSAGNSGPEPRSVSSIAPWMMSVAASGTDRLFVDKVVLGNGTTVVGYSLNAFTLEGKQLPLIYDAASPTCLDGSFNTSLVKGKIVLCDQFPGYSEAKKAGAAGSIMKNVVDKVSFVVSFPASALSSDNYNSIISYINTAKEPQAEILKTEAIKDSDAPVVASFSSRGPNEIAPDILKPDISAPGVDILAAYSPIAPISIDPEDKRRAKYNILIGTSMSCPHTAGVAAYVKSFHPDWSPSAIKSAIMTTAWPMKSSNNEEAEFAYGSGHINPIEAVKPGLVYETFKQDYINMLCSIGYDERKVRSISGDNSTCPEGSKQASPKDLNYPSMAAQVSAGKPFTIKFPRTVTNVGLPNSTYKAKILQNEKLSIKVVPEVLSFRSLNEKKSFNVIVTGMLTGQLLSAALVWSDGNHNARSPIIVHAQGAQG